MELSEDPNTRLMIEALVSKKLRFVIILSAVYLIGFVGTTVLAGFARPLMASKAIGPLNVGFVLIAANYVLSWVLALIYVHVANNTFDPMVAKVVAVIRGRAS